MRKIIYVVLIITMVAVIIGGVYIVFPPHAESIMIAVSKTCDPEDKDVYGAVPQNEYVYVNRRGEYCSVVGSDNKFYKSKLRTVLHEESFNRLLAGEVFDFPLSPDGTFLKSFAAMKARDQVDDINGNSAHKDLGPIEEIGGGVVWSFKIKNINGEVIEIARFTDDDCWVLDDDNAVEIVKKSVRNWNLDSEDLAMQKAIWNSLK